MEYWGEMLRVFKGRKKGQDREVRRSGLELRDLELVLPEREVRRGPVLASSLVHRRSAISKHIIILKDTRVGSASSLRRAETDATRSSPARTPTLASSTTRSGKELVDDLAEGRNRLQCEPSTEVVSDSVHNRE